MEMKEMKLVPWQLFNKTYDAVRSILLATRIVV